MLRSQVLQGCLAAIVATLAALACNSTFFHDSSIEAPLLCLLVAVGLATWFGGAYPGLLATTLGVIWTGLQLVPALPAARSERFEQVLHLTLFATLGVGISLWLKPSRAGRGTAPRAASHTADAPPQLLWTTRPDGVSGYRLWFNERWYEIPVLGAPPDGHAAVAPAERAAPTSDIPSHLILVVDDSQESAETLAWVLESLGQRVAALFDGASVLEWVTLNRPDIVFLDLGMPGLNGYEVAQSIRRHPQLA
ncbi:MAG: response regulator, partial [Planctomycetaceae bacterium]|nr:response regulator [Planctomycetaceae bacterium]